MEKDFAIFGTSPAAHGAEAAQFDRVIAILYEARAQIGPWCSLLLNHNFMHSAGMLIDTDVDWNGQIDLLLLSEHKIVVYELKGFTAKVVYGKTDNSPWIIQKGSADKAESVRSYFQQASKERAFLQRDFLPKFDERHPEYSGNHWLVDARVVFKSGSDISRFFYKVPLTETEDELERNVLAKLPKEDDRDLVRHAFSGQEQGTGKLHRIKLPVDQYEHLKLIYRENGFIPRTQKWFRLVTEDRIGDDLLELGSLRFTLSKGIANEMIQELLNPN